MQWSAAFLASARRIIFRTGRRHEPQLEPRHTVARTTRGRGVRLGGIAPPPNLHSPRCRRKAPLDTHCVATTAHRAGGTSRRGAQRTAFNLSLCPVALCGISAVAVFDLEEESVPDGARQDPGESRSLPAYGTLGPSIVAPPWSRVTFVALPASIANVKRSAGSNATPNW